MLQLVSILLMFITFPFAWGGYFLLKSKYTWIRWIGFGLTYPFCTFAMLGFKD